MLLLDEPLGALDLKLRKQMQLELKRIQHEVGITFVHVTHDQEEAMTMADTIAVMNAGQIEQLGAPTELYERPSTAFVAGFLGVSNLLAGETSGPATPSGSPDGTVVRVRRGDGPARAGRRRHPAGEGAARRRRGEHDSPATYARAPTSASRRSTSSTPPRAASRVYVQNTEAGAGAVQPGDQVTLGWSPEATFVVDSDGGDGQ